MRMDYDSGFTDNVGMLRSSHAEIRMFPGRMTASRSYLLVAVALVRSTTPSWFWLK
jgi:hypothetical protein